jgi:ATP-binding cassette subfamily C protein CydCD
LAAALVRFLDPLDGVVALDEHDLRQLSTADVRRSVGLVDDAPHIFSSTLAENVRLARPDSSDADVQAALDQAHLRSWSRSLPDGLDTFLGAGAAAVSGGERARIALARSLLADQSVLVLDEPSAHLDSATARAVTDDLLEATTGRSLVLITHRYEDLTRVEHVIDLGSCAATSERLTSRLPLA